ncbi:hypothetical protein CLOM_g22985 [Closterium sp. NIES-68]|nr:hypothetical protein CLOM_g22985 [Closterium sp. NIES-68]
MGELFSDLVAVRVQPSTTPIPPIAIHAFAVFRTSAAAAGAVLFLSSRCIVPSHSSRPLIGRLQRPPAVAPSIVDAPSAALVSHGTGFISIRAKRGGQYTDDKKHAITTSHCVQPNTVEYELGVEWRVAQQREVQMVKALLKAHQAELNSLMQANRGK